jgi:DNA-binding response OmpR family regulator
MSAPRRVLVADDEPSLLRVLTFLLGKQGHEVRAAEDGEEALRLAEEFRPHLLILDVMMPKMNGYDVCRKVRGELQLEKSYIVLLSARAQAADREMGLEAGADEYVTKPFASAAFLDHVREIFERIAGRDADDDAMRGAA